jgi:hypothetical protein
MRAEISLVTPTFHGDLESCRLLCDSIDTFVTGYDRHYLVVTDEDVAMFSSFATEKRLVIAESALLPQTVWPLPDFLRWKGRRYYWAPGIGLPVYGWHMQQLRKLAMTVHQPCPRVMCLDSDNCFVRPIDLAKELDTAKSPLYADLGGVNPERPHHVVWQHNAYRLLGFPEPTLPGDDYVGQMIVWDRESVASILKRIETVTKLPWWKALCRARNFSEYILYGVGVMNDQALRSRHEVVTDSLCHSYWSGPALDEAGIAAHVAGMTSRQCAISIQSHTTTASSLIRKVAFAGRG